MKSNPRVMCAAAIFPLLTVVAPPASATDFDHVDVRANRVVSTHQAPYAVQIDDSFELLGEFHHQQASGKRLFNVSLAAYSNGGDIIMVHAETLADQTGDLDYGHLSATTLNGIGFGLREQCVPTEAATEIAANPQARFVRSRGFELTLPFYLMQFLQASTDGNAEIAISYGQAVASCEAIPDALKQRVRRKIEQSVSVATAP